MADTSSSTWTSPRWLEVFAEQAAMFRSAVGDADQTADVPSCPGWTFAELTVHVGRFLRDVTAYLSSGSRVQLPPQPLPRIEDPLLFLDDQLAAASPVLTETPANLPVWTFSPAAPDLAWVWQRRAAHELNLRRWDAQAALRTLEPTDREQAADAIDELLGTVLAARMVLDMPPDATGTALVTCTDGPQSWLVELAPPQAPRVRLAAPDKQADATVRNSTSNLLYQLWGRMQLTAEGDRNVLRAIRMP